MLGIVLADRQRTEYLLDQLGARMSVGSMRNVVYALRDFGDWAVAKGHISSHCLLKRDVPPKPAEANLRLHQGRSSDSCLRRKRQGLRWWELVTTLADTGRRVGEVLSFEWSAFRLEDQPAYVELPKTKSGEPQYVPLPRRLREEVFTPENIIRLKNETKGTFGGEFAARSRSIRPLGTTQPCSAAFATRSALRTEACTDAAHSNYPSHRCRGPHPGGRIPRRTLVALGHDVSLLACDISGLPAVLDT